MLAIPLFQSSPCIVLVVLELNGTIAVNLMTIELEHSSAVSFTCMQSIAHRFMLLSDVASRVHGAQPGSALPEIFSSKDQSFAIATGLQTPTTCVLVLHWKSDLP